MHSSGLHRSMRESRRASLHSLTHFFLCRFREDAAALKAAWDAQIAQMSKEAVSKDLQVQMLQEEEMKLKAQVARFQQDIDRYCPQGSACAISCRQEPLLLLRIETTPNRLGPAFPGEGRSVG